jgi:hypothetical protein
VFISSTVSSATARFSQQQKKTESISIINTNNGDMLSWKFVGLRVVPYFRQTLTKTELSSENLAQVLSYEIEADRWQSLGSIGKHSQTYPG